MSAALPGRRPSREGDHADGAARKRGRPPRLSRQRVVDATLRLIDRSPGEPITIGRVAAEVGASPAALYRHFENLDDLLDAIVAYVLSDLDDTRDERAPWQEQLASWMRSLRARLLRMPGVLALIGRAGRTSPAWIDAASVLLEILEHAGLTSDDLAVTYLWVLETTTGLVLQEAAQPVSDQLANARASKAEWSDEATSRFARISRSIDSIDGDRFFSFAGITWGSRPATSTP